jgi:arabinose-5-phosphate isomerase
MSGSDSVRQQTLSPLEQLRQARAIIAGEAAALATVARRIDGQFCQAVELFYRCTGSVITIGMGKAGLIAQKLCATLASTGTRSHHLHPGEAVHGDLGRIGRDDVLLVLSQSGETEEIVRLLPSLGDLAAAMVAIVGNRSSALGRAADVVIELGPVDEACFLGLAPSSSTTAMLAVGDALALVTSQMRNFGREDFARFHPAGKLGRQLAHVEQYMRPLADCRVAEQSLSVREVFIDHGRGGRRTGAIMLVDAAGALCGLFTDSDLARLFEHKRDAAIDRPIHEVMTSAPLTVPQGSLMADAVAIMSQRKISELPVLDPLGKPVGLVDITDVVGLFPEVVAGGEGAPDGGQQPLRLVGTEPTPVKRPSKLPPRECA